MSTIKGIFLKHHINRVKDKKGDTGIKLLEKLYEQPLKFNSFKNYPTKEEERLIKCCLKVIYNDRQWKDENIRAGRFHWESFAEHPVTKAAIAIGGTGDIRKLIHISEKLMNTIIQDVDYNVSYEGENKMKLVCKKFDYHPKLLQGLFEAIFEDKRILENPDMKVKIETKVINPHEYEYMITWNQ